MTGHRGSLPLCPVLAVKIAALQAPKVAYASREPGDASMHLLALPSAGSEFAMPVRVSRIDPKAEESLRRSSYLSLRDVSCLSSEGVLFLHGNLPSYYLKQVAQEIASGVEGVHHVVNRIKVWRGATVTRP